MDILQTLTRDYGKTIVVVTHDSQKAGYADRVLFLHKGCLVTERPGSVREVA
jgi:putative ABC transport system ATP-binding protein